MYSYAKNVRNLVERSAKAGGATSRIRFLFVISGVPSPINPKRIISNVAATERFAIVMLRGETTICIIDDLKQSLAERDFECAQLSLLNRDLDEKLRNLKRDLEALAEMHDTLRQKKGAADQKLASLNKARSLIINGRLACGDVPGHGPG